MNKAHTDDARVIIEKVLGQRHHLSFLYLINRVVLLPRRFFRLFIFSQTMQDILSESPRCNDMVADLLFPRFFGTAIQYEIARHFPRNVVKVGLNRSMHKYQYFEWGSTLNLDGFKMIIFQLIICEPFRSWKEGLAKLDVNLWEIWRKLKCHRSMSYPPLFFSLKFHQALN